MDAVHPLKVFRLKHDPPLSQQALAERLTKARGEDISRETITRWENGARKPDPELLPVIREVTGISAAKLRPDLAQLFAPERRRGPARSRRASMRKSRAA